MKKLLILGALCGFIAAPAFAQETPFQTNMSKSAAEMEVRNARGAQLTAVTPEQAKANELKRCDPLPEYFKTDCIARINGGGERTGSVIGGGILLESSTTMPEAQLAAEQKNIGPVELPQRSHSQTRRQHKPMR